MSLLQRLVKRVLGVIKFSLSTEEAQGVSFTRVEGERKSRANLRTYLNLYKNGMLEFEDKSHLQSDRSHDCCFEDTFCDWLAWVPSRLSISSGSKINTKKSHKNDTWQEI